MSDRVAEFLAHGPWAAWRRTPLAGDASARRYERLFGPVGQSVVVMDAPQSSGEDVRPFLRIAKHLRRIGLSAPAILAEDAARGILVIEDLGDDLLARLVAADPDREHPLYALATDALIALHRHTPPAGLPRFAAPFAPGFLDLAYGWYPSNSSGQIPAMAAPFRAAMTAALHAHANANDASVMILRDYHAENLLFLPDREGVARLGLLDFQDAMAGHPAYDLASLLTDARRDVSPTIRAAMIARYCSETGRDKATFETAFAVISVQRNLRILGVFARLCLAVGKSQYVELLTRVWGHITRDLHHPALTDLRRIVLRDLPEPTPAHLRHLTERCATCPMP